MATLTIRIDPGLEEMLRRVAERGDRTRSEIVREALRRHLALELFEDARRQIAPFAEARGYLTDDDVFRDIS